MKDLAELKWVCPVCGHEDYFHVHRSDVRLLGQTNADRIRAMSDYELADWLCKILTYCGNRHCNPDCPLFKCCNDQSTDSIEGWLKSPAELREWNDGKTN